MYTITMGELGRVRTVVLPFSENDGIYGLDYGDNSVFFVFTNKETNEKNVFRADLSVLNMPEYKTVSQADLMRKHPEMFTPSPILSAILTWELQGKDVFYEFDRLYGTILNSQKEIKKLKEEIENLKKMR